MFSDNKTYYLNQWLPNFYQPNITFFFFFFPFHIHYLAFTCVKTRIVCPHKGDSFWRSGVNR
jgi:hypothetical protein